MKRLIVGLAFVAAASVAYADERVWEYDADTQILSDGAWTLMAKNLGNQTLRLGLEKDDRIDGRTSEPWAFPAEIDARSAGRLDLTGAVYTKGKTNDESARWTITEIMDGAFNASDDRVTAFVAPTTLTKFGMRVFRFNKGLADIIVKCPVQSGTFCIYGMEFTGSAIPHIVLDMPQVTAIGGANFNKATMAETDLSTWNLSNVKTLEKGALAASGNMSRSGGPTGDLDLPNVETIGDGAFDCWTRVSSVAFGTNGTLKSLGKTLFWNQGAKDGLAAGPTKIDFGKSWNFSVHEQAFYAELPGKVSAWPNGMPLPLEEIWFASKAPSVETLDRILVLQEPGADGAKPVKIYAPTDDETWQAVCRPFADEAEAAAAQATGEAVVGVYARVDGARVAWIVKRPFASVAVATRASSTTGGTVSITAGGVPVASGTELRLGTEVTVTATPAKETTQVSWEGTFPDGTTPTGRSFTFAVSGPVSFHAVFSPAWEYDADAATISDGYWTLKAEQVDTMAQTLKIPTTTDTLDATRTGELNLMGPIYTKGAVGEEALRWTIVEIADKAFHKATAHITSFYAPTTLTGIGWQAFNEVRTFENIVLKCPNLTAEFGQWGYMFGGSGVARLVLDLPKLTVIGRGGALSFASVTFQETDLSEWNLTNLKTVHDNGFASNRGPGPQGTLVLPNVETIGTNAFNGWTRHTAAALGTNGTLKSLDSKIFANNTSALKKLDFGTSAAFEVAADTFLAADDTPLPLEEVWFAGEAPSVDVLDALLALRTGGDDGTKPVKIYAPMKLDSWQAVRKPFEGSERTVALAIRKQTGHRVIGVYVTQDGRRAAWLVQNPNFPYSTGMRFVIR